MNEAWRNTHRIVIDSFLKFLNKKTDQFVLKGGTALMTCYNLDRFSEDIDLDGHSKNIFPIVSEFCNKYGYSFVIKKDTDVVKRCLIDYGNSEHKLKIETSFRRRNFDNSEIRNINGVMVYSLNELCMQKTNAYVHRDKLRDLFDLTFIINYYSNELNPLVISNLSNALSYKGLEQFDYLIQTQPDPLIDSDLLADKVLNMFLTLGILSEKEETHIDADSINFFQELDTTIEQASERVNHKDPSNLKKFPDKNNTKNSGPQL